MADPLHLIAGTLRDAFAAVTSLAVVDIDPVVRPSDRADAQANGALALAKALGRNPRELAQAVVDTGIDYAHDDFVRDGDVTFPTAKVVGGFDFVGDGYNAASDILDEVVPNPDPDPLDCEGHGTHVAGTAAGYGVRSDGSTYGGPYSPTAVADLAIGPGSAPGASLLAYKVFGCSGSTDSAVTVMALDRAFRDGASVANLSLGSPFGERNGVEERTINRLSRAGMLVVVAAGNSGNAPYLVGSPSTADRALSVAAMSAAPARRRSRGTDKRYRSWRRWYCVDEATTPDLLHAICKCVAPLEKRPPSMAR